MQFHPDLQPSLQILASRRQTCSGVGSVQFGAVFTVRLYFAGALSLSSSPLEGTSRGGTFGTFELEWSSIKACSQNYLFWGDIVTPEQVNAFFDLRQICMAVHVAPNRVILVPCACRSFSLMLIYSAERAPGGGRRRCLYYRANRRTSSWSSSLQHQAFWGHQTNEDTSS